MARSRNRPAGSTEAELFDDGSQRSRGVGDALRAERERQGLQLTDVAAQLRIRRVHLAAIEAERFDQLPAGSYATSFLRSYATHLGLDAAEILRRHRMEIDGGHSRVELSLPQPLKESRLPSGLLVAVSVAIAAVAYGAWALLGQDRAPLPRVDPVPAQLQAAAPPPPPPAAPEPAPVPPAAAPETLRATLPAAAPAPAPATNPPATVPAAPPGSATAPAAGAASPPAAPAATAAVASQPTPRSPAPSAPPPAPVPAATAVPAAAPTPTPPAAAPAAPAAERAHGDVGTARVVVTALAESWVQVRDASGAIVFMKIMQAGESYHAPSRRGLTLTTGNAGSIEIRVDGRPVPSVGQVGRVRRDLPIDPEALTGAPGSRAGG
jgi:cytoskeleton protein RodZ